MLYYKQCYLLVPGVIFWKQALSDKLISMSPQWNLFGQIHTQKGLIQNTKGLIQNTV